MYEESKVLSTKVYNFLGLDSNVGQTCLAKVHLKDMDLVEWERVKLISVIKGMRLKSKQNIVGISTPTK